MVDEKSFPNGIILDKPKSDRLLASPHGRDTFAVEARALQPVIHEVLPLTELPRAFEQIEGRKPIGKIVLVPG